MTSYEEVYNRFLGKIEDYSLLETIVSDEAFARDMLYDYLNSAISRFTYSTNKLSELKNNKEERFDIKLKSIEIEILSLLMVVVYLSPKLLKTELLEQRLGSKDFNTYSPANLLQEVRELKNSMQSEADILMIEYYYREGLS